MERYKMVWHNGKVTTEHAAVWEKANCRPVPKGHVIHHINGNGLDNRIENLQLMTHKEHNQLHARLRVEGSEVVDSSDETVMKSRKRNKDWKAANKEYIREYNRKWRAANRETVLAGKHRYYSNNHAVILERARRYAESNRDKIKMAKHERYLRTKEHVAEVAKSRRPIIYALHNLNRAVKLNLPEERIEELSIKVEGVRMAMFFESRR